MSNFCCRGKKLNALNCHQIRHGHCFACFGVVAAPVRRKIAVLAVAKVVDRRGAVPVAVQFHFVAKNFEYPKGLGGGFRFQYGLDDPEVDPGVFVADVSALVGVSRKGCDHHVGVLPQYFQDLVVVPDQTDRIRRPRVNGLVGDNNDSLLGTVTIFVVVVESPGDFQFFSEPPQLGRPDGTVEGDESFLQAFQSLGGVFVSLPEVFAVFAVEDFYGGLSF
mmetsp:Transcript_26799/g.55393  ORF Transcript_26799/g.55393 Transcript_26799/m.55393 type:complete len:220 (+) Transcript_26799:3547-4206(+)